ncbi:MAG: redox-regulated ATPase YchF [Planctomycetes bacterium]|nr:redox-regulated ATPase YchF [Planctomycetota bacterium]
MKAALIGVPSAGKTTVFSAVTGVPYVQAVAAPPGGKRPFGVGVVRDPRIDALTEHFKPKKSTPAAVEFTDFAPLLLEGPGRESNRQVVAAIRETDAAVVVIGVYDPSIGDPWAFAERQISEFRTEFIVSDLDSVERRIEKLVAQSKKATPNREQELKELEALHRLQPVLGAGKPVTEAGLPEAEAKLVRAFAFLSEKPCLWLVNIGEDRLADEVGWTAFSARHPDAVRCSARLEAELLGMPPDERASFASDYGLGDFVLPTLPARTLTALDTIVFLTTGEDEVRAWPIPSGTRAQDAAGVVHSDIARGFIRAEPPRPSPTQTGRLPAVR